jgi:hypothetical protein
MATKKRIFKPIPKPKPRARLMWVNHLSFLPGDPSVKTSFNAVQSHGLVIQSTTTGDEAVGGGNKVVAKFLDVPPGFTIKGVRVCYKLSNARSFISQIRLAQVQRPPGSALVMLDDGTNHTAVGPVCVNSEPCNVDPTKGALELSLRVNFGDTADRIVVLGVGLHLS